VEEAKQRLKSSTGNNSSVLHFVVCSSGLNNEIMTVDRKHTEIFDQDRKKWAEGTSIDANDTKPKEQDIQKLIELEGFKADEIDIWYDNLQKFWRWSCKIAKL